MKSYIKDYPRPQFVRKSWENLNGKWAFAFDDTNQGEVQKWYKSFPDEREIQVPFTYETKLSGIGDEVAHNNIWYSRTLNVEEKDLTQQRVLLHFEGSDYITKVWVNGVFVGEHTGAYARFSFDITHQVVCGVNTITVKVEDSLDEGQLRGKQRWLGENFDCFYVQTTGIWKTVWIEYVPDIYIQTTKMTPYVEDQVLEVALDVCGVQVGSHLTVEASITFEDKFVTQIRIPVLKQHNKMKIDIYSKEVSQWGIKMWSPEAPNLYDITFTLYQNGKVVDQVDSYFGMREITIDQQNVLLNGIPLYQKLVLDQGYWKDSHLTPPSEEALIEDIEKTMALGYNGVRKHQKVEDERFIYWCDVKGLLVWSELGANYTYGDRQAEQLTKEWMEVVKQYYNHPSIITWVPFNESWGLPKIKTDVTQQKFSEAIYYLTKSFDAYRPVVINDGWEQTTTDIVTIHDYQEVGSVFYNRYINYKEEILSNKIYHNGFKATFANGYEYKGQPIILSEFGGIAFNNNDSGFGYGNKVNSQEDFLERFEDIIMAIKEIPYISGYCYTQLTDVQQELNGLLDIDRQFKVASHLIHRVNEKETKDCHHEYRISCKQIYTNNETPEE